MRAPRCALAGGVHAAARSRKPPADAHLQPCWRVGGRARDSVAACARRTTRRTRRQRQVAHGARAQVMVDTSGWAFAYPLARLAGVRVAAYVHYPTVSADMLTAVAARRPGFNNRPALAASAPRSAAKLAYYYAFAAAYGAAGACANVRPLRRGSAQPRAPWRWRGRSAGPMLLHGAQAAL